MTANPDANLIYVYSDSVHPIGTVQMVGDCWRASTRHELLVFYESRDEAIEAVHEAHGDGGAS